MLVSAVPPATESGSEKFSCMRSRWNMKSALLSFCGPLVSSAPLSCSQSSLSSFSAVLSLPFTS